MNKKKKTSPSIPLPLQILGPGARDETSRELQMVDPASSAFKLPRGWFVEERPRFNSPSHPGRVDKYYYEPGTGRQFRSLIGIQKYLSGETEDAIMPKRVKLGNRNYMQTVACTTKNASSFGLPDQWIVEEKPRSRGGIVDKYYIERGTGLRFRSRIAVKRYLTKVRETASTTKAKPDKLTKDMHEENHSLRITVKHQRDAGKIKIKPKALKLDGHSMPSKTSSFWKKRGSGEEVNPTMDDFSSPPAKVKWVLGGPAGNMWNLFVGESTVPESVKREWFKTFLHYLYDKD